MGILSSLKQTVKEWKKHNPLFLGAGISFYIILSLGPLLVLMFFVLGNILTEEKAITGFIGQLERVVGERPSRVITSIIQAATSSSPRLLTTLTSIPLIFFGSTMIFFQLKYALNIIFEADKNQDESLKDIIKRYSFSFLMLLVLAVFLFLIIIKEPSLILLQDYLREFIPISWILFRILEITFSFSILVLLFMMIYLVLPDKKLEKKKVFYGSVVTALLFIISQFLIGINAEYTRIDNAIGAIGSFTILILWIFYSSLVFLFGAAFTKVVSKEKDYF
jgi:membrane protein